MARAHKPRSGSLQFWPRKRAKRQYPRVKAWINLADARLLGFAGYKVGMTHVQLIDNRPNSLSKNDIITWPVTIIECPPLKPFSLRFYKKTYYGLKAVSEILSNDMDKELKRRLRIKKTKENKEAPKEFDELRLLVYTQPKLVGIGKKKPEIFELGLSSNNLEFAKSLLNKEIKINEVFKEGEFLDIHAVTKGKGFQGPVKRFGISLRAKKSEKTKRGPGSLGAWTPKKVSFRVAHAGQMGYHTRTEVKKQLLMIGNKPEEVNKKSGFPHYGVVKNDFVLVKGSVPGPAKRLIRLAYSLRDKKQQPITIKSIIK